MVYKLRWKFNKRKGKIKINLRCKKLKLKNDLNQLGGQGDARKSKFLLQKWIRSIMQWLKIIKIQIFENSTWNKPKFVNFQHQRSFFVAILKLLILKSRRTSFVPSGRVTLKISIQIYDSMVTKASKETFEPLGWKIMEGLVQIATEWLINVENGLFWALGPRNPGNFDPNFKKFGAETSYKPFWASELKISALNYDWNQTLGHTPTKRHLFEFSSSRRIVLNQNCIF